MSALADLCELIIDCEHKTAPVQDEGYPSIRTPNIGRGRFLLDGVNRVSEETYRAWTKRAVPMAGDLILAREAPVGNVAVIPAGEQFCLGQRTVLIRPKAHLVDSDYLCYLLLAPELQAQLLGKSGGATVHHLNMKDIRALDMPEMPALGVQRRVALAIKNYDDLIATNQHRIALLEQAARLLYREWFVQLRFPGHESVRVENGLPAGWRRLTLGELCDEVPAACVQTGPFGSQLHQHDYKPDGVPVVMPQDIVGDRIRHDKIAFVDEATAVRLDRHALQPLDIVFPRRGDIAKRALVEPHQAGYLCGTGCLKISLPPAPLHPLLLYFQLADPTMVKWIEGQAVGATMLNLSATILKSANCLVPSADVQARFVALASDLRAQIDLIERANIEAARARDLLLPKLMSGQLDVSRLPLPEEAMA